MYDLMVASIGAVVGVLSARLCVRFLLPALDFGYAKMVEYRLGRPLFSWEVLPHYDPKRFIWTIVWPIGCGLGGAERALQMFGSGGWSS
jgi:hypothetical protein